MKKFIGIDIAKATFSVAFPQPDGGYQVEEFSNNEEGISTLLPGLDKQAHYVMEATGSYSMLLSYTLSEQGYIVSVINPRQAAHFSQMLLRVTKTDRMDVPRRMLYYWQSTVSICNRLSFSLTVKPCYISSRKEPYLGN